MNRLLIVKLSSFGDVLHALPVVKSIKLDKPDLSVGWVVRQRCAGLVEGAEFLDKVYVIRDYPSVRDLYELAHNLRRDGYDTAFDMQGLLLSGLITFLSGAKTRVGLNRNREMNKLFLTDASVEGLLPNMHAVDVQLGFRRAAALDKSDDLPPLTHLGHASFDWLRNLQTTFTGKPVVVLNVGASTLYKRWPTEQWIALAKLLLDDHSEVVITAGPSEAEDAHSIAAALPSYSSLLDLGGETNPDQLAAVLASADLCISGDTGPMHLAASVGTPTLALFGPTDPRLTGPYGIKNRIIWKQLSCSPCFRHPTCSGRVDCLKAISADEVFRAAREMLNLKSTRITV